LAWHHLLEPTTPTTLPHAYLGRCILPHRFYTHTTHTHTHTAHKRKEEHTPTGARRPMLPPGSWTSHLLPYRTCCSLYRLLCSMPTDLPCSKGETSTLLAVLLPSTRQQRFVHTTSPAPCALRSTCRVAKPKPCLAYKRHIPTNTTPQASVYNRHLAACPARSVPV